MASNYPDLPDEDPSEFCPKLKLKDDTAPPPTPDSEENVGRETEGIFRSFMCQSYQQEMTTDNIEQIEQTPALPELTNFTLHPMRRISKGGRRGSIILSSGEASEIGRQLAMIGDDINERHKKTFDQMIVSMKLGNAPELAYEAFAGIARRLFHDGTINWGRIITLLTFGYRMAINVLTSGVRGFFSKIVRFVVDFIIKEKIAKWIAEQGGWIAALRYIPESIGPGTLICIGVLAACTICVAVWLSKR